MPAPSLTPAQRNQLAAVEHRIAERYPGEDFAALREAALSAATRVILGEDTLEEVASRYLALRRSLNERHSELTGALIATGGPETRLAERAGITRATVRKALGKQGSR